MHAFPILSKRFTLPALLSGCALLLSSTSLPAQDKASETVSKSESVVIQEWLVPWENTRPRDPFVAPDGMVWFVGQGGDYAAWFNPQDESFERIDMEAGAGPHNLIVDADGIVWYAGNKAAHIGRIDPTAADGEQIKQFPTPKDSASDPHTLIEADSGHIWFTAQHSNSVGRFDPASGEVEITAIPTSNARPYGIDLDSNGTPWVVLLGTNKLARINPQNMAVTEIDLPRAATRPRRLSITEDDSIWYVDYAEGYLGRYQPDASDGNKITEWSMPGREDGGAGNSGPYGMAVDNDNRLWIVETFPDPNRFVGFDTDSESFISVTDIPSGAGSVRHMYYNANDNSIWFGTDTNYLGQARLTADSE